MGPPRHIPPGHVWVDTLKKDGDKAVYRMTTRGSHCATRIIRTGVALALGPPIRLLVTDGRGSTADLPTSVQSVLEGYRVRATLREFRGLPAIITGGLVPDDHDSSIGHCYVSTLWVEGESLWHLLSQDGTKPGPLRSFAELAAVFEQVLEILERLHGRNVLFGDVKPQNIIVETRPEGPVGGTTVSLVDMDTLRKVGNADEPAPLALHTPQYAAPELQRGIAYLASDIYAFGRTVEAACSMAQQEPSDRWKFVIEACLRERPTDRPRAGAIRAFLYGQHPTLPTWSGERFEGRSQGETELTAPSTSGEAGGTTTPPRDTEALTRRVPDEGVERGARLKLSPRGRIIVGILVIGALIGAGVHGWHRVRARQQANSQAAVIRADLRTYKTVRERNNRRNLKAIVDRAAANVSLAATPDSLGVYALSWVWLQGWHYSKARWKPKRFTQGLAITERALHSGQTPEALLAHALQTGAACRLSDLENAKRDHWCKVSLEHATKALTSIRQKRDRRWMVVEAAWAGVLTASSWAAQLEKSGDGTAADRMRRSALDLCRTAEADLDAAPINGEELIQDCMRVAGALHEYKRWRGWADWLVDQRIAKDLPLQGATRHVFTSLFPECWEMELDAKGLPKSPSHEPTGSFEDLCGYIGYIVLGCNDEAQSFRTCIKGSWYYNSSCQICSLRDLSWSCQSWATQPGVPWQAVVDEIGKVARPKCLLQSPSAAPTGDRSATATP